MYCVHTEAQTALTVVVHTCKMLTLTFYDSCISVPAPRIRAVTDHKRNVVRLKLMNTDVKRQDEIMCQMIWNGMPGEVLPWVSQSLNNSYLFVLLEKHILSLFFFNPLQLKGKREIVISSNAVAPCLCFEVDDILIVTDKKKDLQNIFGNTFF